MDVLLAVLVFTAIAAIAWAVRSEDTEAPTWDDPPRHVPVPSPRDRYAVTGMLDRAPVPNWG